MLLPLKHTVSRGNVLKQAYFTKTVWGRSAWLWVRILGRSLVIWVTANSEYVVSVKGEDCYFLKLALVLYFKMKIQVCVCARTLLKLATLQASRMRQESGSIWGTRQIHSLPSWSLQSGIVCSFGLAVKSESWQTGVYREVGPEMVRNKKKQLKQLRTDHRDLEIRYILRGTPRYKACRTEDSQHSTKKNFLIISNELPLNILSLPLLV